MGSDGKIKTTLRGARQKLAKRRTKKKAKRNKRSRAVERLKRSDTAQEAKALKEELAKSAPSVDVGGTVSKASSSLSAADDKIDALQNKLGEPGDATGSIVDEFDDGGAGMPDLDVVDTRRQGAGDMPDLDVVDSGRDRSGDLTDLFED